MKSIACADELPQEKVTVMLWCADKKAAAVGWYIGSLHADPRSEYRAYDLKPGERGWVTTESAYNDAVVLPFDAVSHWCALPPAPV